MTKQLENPFRPGAGHQPPYLAGRKEETEEFTRLLEQKIVMQNLVLTGLRGIGKTVLLESFKPIAQRDGWLWAGTDCSESATVSEDTMAIRLLTDVALLTSGVKISEEHVPGLGFQSPVTISSTNLTYDVLLNYYNGTPGLPTDKLRATLVFVWKCVEPINAKGIIFAYDEAQTLTDHAEEKQFPLSMLLDTFQYLQRLGIPYLLVLTGLPSLVVKLVETRTYTERLSKVLTLGQLSAEESKEAIVRPIASSGSVGFTEASISLLVKQSGGYPYFIQFLCREVFDIFNLQYSRGEELSVPMDALLQKLDNDFFAARWARATEREKDLLTIIAQAGLEEFGVQQVATLSQENGKKPFSKSQVGQMFVRLIDAGLVYKDRRGAYSFAVPLLNGYINRLFEADINRLQPRLF